jgi:hypothetical protein
MTDRNKFEEMLERLVNEDKEGAEALFHEIVVEKSRDIYESLLEDEEVEETTDEEVDEAADEEVDESEEDLDEATDEEVDEASDEDLDESDEELDEADEEVDENFFDMAEGDPVDDMMGDIEDPDMGGDDMEPEMGDDDMGMGDEEGDVEDRVADLEDELEALKAEFEAMMGDEEPGDEEPADDMPMDMDSEEGEDDEAEEEAVAFEATDEEVEEATDEEVEEATDEVEESKTPKSQTEIMREYTDKVSASMGDNGANSKSVVAGKNDMGGTTANIAKGGDGGAGGTAGGLAAPSTKEDNAGNVNVPGGKASKSMKSQPGHGAEKKGKPETADKGAGSPLNGAPKRAK